MALLPAADRKLPIEQTSNDLVDISATAILDKEQIKQELGSDFGGDIVVIRVTIRPVSDRPIQVSLDDFLLVSGKDGQRAQPYSPSQIAGNSTLVVTPQGTRKWREAQSVAGNFERKGAAGERNNPTGIRPSLFSDCGRKAEAQRSGASL